MRLPRWLNSGPCFWVIDEAKLESCRKRFAQNGNIVAVWIMGSAVTNRLRDESDIDFAILYAEDAVPDYSQLNGLSSDLDSILGRRVDLGRLNTRNLIYAHEAIRHGVRLYSRNEVEADRFVEKVLALYFDLKRDRRVVEDAYCA